METNDLIEELEKTKQQLNTWKKTTWQSAFSKNNNKKNLIFFSTLNIQQMLQWNVTNTYFSWSSVSALQFARKMPETQDCLRWNKSKNVHTNCVYPYNDISHNMAKQFNALNGVRSTQLFTQCSKVLLSALRLECACTAVNGLVSAKRSS